MIKLTRSEQFLKDLEETLEWLYFRAAEEGRDPNQIEKDFKKDFLKALSHIQSNPFIYSSYGPANPTRRAIFFHGNYIIDYQLIPVQSNSKENVEEVILTSLVPALSDRFHGAYEGLEAYNLGEEE
jgi:hypothetical protein